MPRQKGLKAGLAAHARWLARRRSLLAFIRACTEPETRPQFYDIARLARARGLFPRKSWPRQAGLWLERIWVYRAYYDSVEADQRQLKRSTRMMF